MQGVESILILHLGMFLWNNVANANPAVRQILTRVVESSFLSFFFLGRELLLFVM